MVAHRIVRELRFQHDLPGMEAWVQEAVARLTRLPAEELGWLGPMVRQAVQELARQHVTARGVAADVVLDAGELEIRLRPIDPELADDALPSQLFFYRS